ncbi:MAG: ATP-binding protein [Flavobacteriia bacterium]|nr:ATP-binding protein [Flavobacteriia bacterium]
MDDKKHIDRAVFSALKEKLKPQKVLILLGARRVGKTNLIKTYLKELKKEEYILFNGDDQRTIDAFTERSVQNFNKIIGDKKTIVIDEAQKIPDIGLKLKLMVDEIEDVKIIATGSSVFDLSNKLGEPLVGREHTLRLYPLAQLEFNPRENYLETKDKLTERLIFGSYPELEHIKSWKEKADYLEGIVNSYLLRDILEYQGIKKANKIIDLLRLIAFQVGKEVNIDELALNLKGISRNTIEVYLDLLSKVFIIYNVKGFSRNLRKEIVKTSRWYFYDNGIRNAIIRNFSELEMRADKGDLWENYLMSERIKFNAYTNKRVNYYFWRTYDQQEIDLIEEEADVLRAFEFKWNPKKKVKVPGGWKNNYPTATFEVIHPDNYLDFIS